MKKKANIKATISRIIKVIILPVVVYLLFTILSKGTFGNAEQMGKMIGGSLYAVSLAWGVMILWTSGLNDMGCGAVVYLAAIIGGNTSKMLGLGEVGFVICIILTAIVLQTISGLVISLLKLPAMAASFGTAMAYEAMTQFVFGGTGISTSYYKLALVPWNYIALAVTAVLVILLLNYTKIGRHMRAMGKAPELAQNMGINIVKTKILTYTISGVFIGIASVMYLTRAATITAIVEMQSFTLSMNAIMAVVIGIFLGMYCDKILGTFIGAIVMTMLGSGLLAIRVPATLQPVFQSLFLLIFMVYSTNQYKIMQYFKDKKRAKLIQAQIDGNAVKAEV